MLEKFSHQFTAVKKIVDRISNDAMGHRRLEQDAAVFANGD